MQALAQRVERVTARVAKANPCIHKTKRDTNNDDDNDAAAPTYHGLAPDVRLYEHQRQGLQWLACLHEAGVRGAILGDEMGLGKTLQAIAFLGWLRAVRGLRPPYLVVAPLPLVRNWVLELQRFAGPSVLRVLEYRGDKQKRTALRQGVVEHILATSASALADPADVSFDVMVTSYELVMADMDFVKRFKWRYLIIDEAHRLKNHESKLYTMLRQHLRPLPPRLLLTGTPMQNNLTELWSLLHFVAPSVFLRSDRDVLVSSFAHIPWRSMALTQHEGASGAAGRRRVAQLHSFLRPFLLRRLKADVLHDLPAKTELVLYATLSPMQRRYYRSMLLRDASSLSSGGASAPSLRNVLMQLRKVCNHPYLFDGAEPVVNGEYEMGEHLVENSGKMVVLDMLLKKLHRDGHRVLLFSQMTRVLDILQDYLSYREERHLAVNTFGEGDTFVFLLSTRAGGQGLNLVAADTVIFFDSDWNPQSDLQAQARAHRIGQTAPVRVIRLLSRHTVEHHMYRRAMRKLYLSATVIERGGFHATSGIDSGGDGGDGDGGDGHNNGGPDGDANGLHAIGRHGLFDAIKFGLSKLFPEDEEGVGGSATAVAADGRARSSPQQGASPGNASSGGVSQADIDALLDQALQSMQRGHGDGSPTPAGNDSVMTDANEDEAEAEADKAPHGDASPVVCHHSVGAATYSPSPSPSPSPSSVASLEPATLPSALQRATTMFGSLASIPSTLEVIDDDDDDEDDNDNEGGESMGFAEDIGGSGGGGGSGDDYDARTTKQATSPPGLDDPQQQGQADDKRLQALLAEAGGGGVTTMTSSGSRALRSRRTTSRVEEPRSPGAVEADRAAQQAAKEARARKRRERKWSTTGYVSTKLEMDAMDGGAAGDGDGDDVVGVDDATHRMRGHDGDGDDTMDEGDEEGDYSSEHDSSIHYVLGDVTQPTVQRDHHIVVIVADTSGRWTNRGLFGAVARVAPDAPPVYERAKENLDLHMSDVHVCAPVAGPGQGVTHVALVIAQARHRPGSGSAAPVQLPALRTAFAQLSRYARSLPGVAAVHLPRIGADTPNFNWYATERVLRDAFVVHHVPTYVYYFPRRQRKSAPLRRPRHRVPSSPSTPKRAHVAATTMSDPRDHRRTKRVRSASKGLARRQSLGASGSGSGSGVGPLPDTFAGVCAHMVAIEGEEQRQLRRRLIAFGGSVVGLGEEEELEGGGGGGGGGSGVGGSLHAVTHVVVHRDAASQVHVDDYTKDVILVTPDWVFQSSRKGCMLPERDYLAIG